MSENQQLNKERISRNLQEGSDGRLNNEGKQISQEEQDGNAAGVEIQSNLKSFFDEKLQSHKRRHIFDKTKGDEGRLESKIANRVANRSKARAAKRASSRGSSRGSSAMEDQPIPLGNLLNLATSFQNGAQNDAANNQESRNMILEQEQEDTLHPDDEDAHREYQVPQVLTQSWEDAIQTSTNQYVKDLIQHAESKLNKSHLAEEQIESSNVSQKPQPFKRGPTIFLSKRKSTEQSQDELEDSKYEQRVEQKPSKQIDSVLEQNQFRQAAQIEREEDQILSLNINNQSEAEKIKLQTEIEASEEATNNALSMIIAQILSETSQAIDVKLAQKLQNRTYQRIEQAIIKEMIRQACGNFQNALDNTLADKSFDKVISILASRILREQSEIQQADLEEKVSQNLQQKLETKVVDALFYECLAKIEKKQARIAQLNMTQTQEEEERQRRLQEENQKIEEKKLKVQTEFQKLQAKKAKLLEIESKIQSERQQFLEDQKKIELENNQKFLQEQQRLQDLERKLKEEQDKQALIKTKQNKEEIKLEESISQIPREHILAESMRDPDKSSQQSEKQVDSSRDSKANPSPYKTVPKTQGKFVGALYKSSPNQNTPAQESAKSKAIQKIEPSRVTLPQSEKFKSGGLSKQASPRQSQQSNQATKLSGAALSKEDFDAQFKMAEDAVDGLQEKLFTELLKQEVEVQEKSLEQRVLDRAMLRLKSRVIGEMIQEQSLIIESDLIEKVSTSAADKAQETMIKRVVDLYLTIDEQRSKSLQQKNKFLNAQQQHIYQLPYQQYKPKNQPENEAGARVRKIKKMHLKRKTADLSGMDFQDSSRYEFDLATITKELSKKQTQMMKDMKIQDVLDIEFFEKCFFGKKLLNKDQKVFRVYANELLELIKNNLSKDLKKKYKVFKDQKKAMLKEKLKQNSNGKKKNSKSPEQKFDTSLELKGYKLLANYRSTKTPEPRELEENDPGLNDEILNIYLPKQMNRGVYKKRNNSVQSATGNLQDLQPPNMIENNGFQNFDPQVKLIQAAQQDYNLNAEGTIGAPQIDPSGSIFYKGQMLTLSNDYGTTVTPEGSKINIKGEDYSKAIKGRKKRQPSQVKVLNYEDGMLAESSTNNSFMGGRKRTPNQTPPKNQQQAQNQIRVYQNLETQIKDILRNKNSALSKIRTKRRIANNSERHSPVPNNDLESNQNFQMINFMPRAQMQNEPMSASMTPLLIQNKKQTLKQRIVDQQTRGLGNVRHIEVNRFNPSPNEAAISAPYIPGSTLTSNVDLSRQTAEQQTIKQFGGGGTFSTNQNRIGTPQSPNQSLQLQQQLSGQNQAQFQADYQLYKKKNEMEIMAISTPKQRIDQIIEKARKSKFRGSEVHDDSPHHLQVGYSTHYSGGFGNSLTRPRDLSNGKKNPRTLSNLKHTELKAMDYNKLEPFIQDFISSKQQQKLNTQQRLVAKTKQKGKLRKDYASVAGAGSVMQGSTSPQGEGNIGDMFYSNRMTREEEQLIQQQRQMSKSYFAETAQNSPRSFNYKAGVGAIKPQHQNLMGQSFYKSGFGGSNEELQGAQHTQNIMQSAI